MSLQVCVVENVRRREFKIYQFACLFPRSENAAGRPFGQCVAAHVDQTTSHLFFTIPCSPAAQVSSILRSTQTSKQNGNFPSSFISVSSSVGRSCYPSNLLYSKCSPTVATPHTNPITGMYGVSCSIMFNVSDQRLVTRQLSLQLFLIIPSTSMSSENREMRLFVIKSLVSSSCLISYSFLISFQVAWLALLRYLIVYLISPDSDRGRSSSNMLCRSVYSWSLLRARSFFEEFSIPSLILPSPSIYQGIIENATQGEQHLSAGEQHDSDRKGNQFHGEQTQCFLIDVDKNAGLHLIHLQMLTLSLLDFLTLLKSSLNVKKYSSLSSSFHVRVNY